MSVLWLVLGLLCVSTFARGQVERCYYCYDTDSSCDRGTALAKQTCTFDLGSANQEANPQKSSSGSYSSSGSEFPENFGNPNSRGGGQYSCVVARIYDNYNAAYLTKRSCIPGIEEERSCAFLKYTLRRSNKELLNCTTCFGDLCNSSGAVKSSLLISGLVVVFMYFFI